MTDECENAPSWNIQTEDGAEHEACSLHVPRVMQDIVYEYGDGAPVFLWMIEDGE